jgi:hypothetical protein
VPLPANAIFLRKIPAALLTLFTEPPAWTRLEPQTITGDPTPGLEARVHDPLWLLARQWQLGEFAGADAGSPVLIHVAGDTTTVTAWQPGAPGANRPARPVPDGAILDPLVEREPTPAFALGLRQRAEAGAYLVELLADAGFDARAALVAACRLPLGPVPADPNVPPEHTQVPDSLLLLGSAVPDGAAAAGQLEAAGAGTPAWLAGASAPAVAAARTWLAWYRAGVAPTTDPADDCWDPERLEYRFSVRVGAGAGQLVMRASAFEGGAIDWYAFDCQRGAKVAVAGEAAGPPPQSRTLTMLAAPLRFAGMPADRYWEFEDGQVNLGQLEAQPHDLARLCLTEFAMVYGGDWSVVPLDVSAGSFTVLREVAYTTTFGERFVVPRADDGGRSGRFRLFEVTAVNDKGQPDPAASTVPGLFVPPTGLGTLEGRPLEDVFVLRDEMANMAWAVEGVVQGRSGDPRARGDEARPSSAVERLEPDTVAQYILATEVPRNWIPFVPIAVGTGAIALRKGTMYDTDTTLGVLFHTVPYTLRDEEVPRSGVRVRRVPALARAADGRYLRWIGRRVTVGRGEGNSGLAYDSALRPNQSPPA